MAKADKPESKVDEKREPEMKFDEDMEKKDSGEDKKAKEAVLKAGKGVMQFINETRKVLKAQKRRKIVIPSTERDKDAVVVSINGYVYNIPRDKEVEVPEGVVEVLRNAKMKIYTVKTREDGEGNELIEQEVARVPFQTVE